MKVTRIATGNHMIEIKPTGCYAAWTHDVAVEAGKPLPIVRAELKPAEVKARIQSEQPHAKVYLIEGGIRTTVGETPLQVTLNPTRSYTLALARAGYRESTQEVHFDGSCELTALAKLERINAGASGGDGSGSAAAQTVAAPTEPPSPTAKEASEGESREARPPHERLASASRAPKPPAASPADVPEDGGAESRDKPALVKSTGFLKVGARPWMKITIDGQDYGSTPNPKIQLAPGRHKLTLSNPQFDVNFSQTIEIRPNEPTTVIKNFEKGSDGKPAE